MLAVFEQVKRERKPGFPKEELRLRLAQARILSFFSVAQRNPDYSVEPAVALERAFQMKGSVAHV